MRIGILSDTHNQLDRTQSAVELLRRNGADVLIHCGDFTEAAILELLAESPCYFVFGNNDDDAIVELRAAAKTTGAVCLEWGGVVALGGKQVAVTHGHLTSEIRSLLAQSPDYLLFGHSHVRADQRRGSVRWINPGALYRAKDYSVAVLDLATDELQFLEIPSRRLAGMAATKSVRKPAK